MLFFFIYGNTELCILQRKLCEFLKLVRKNAFIHLNSTKNKKYLYQ